MRASRPRAQRQRMTERDISASREGGDSKGSPELLHLCYSQSWAVVVGINSYDHVDDLEYGRADADAMIQALGDVGFEKDHIFSLVDGDATRQNLQDLLSVEMARKTCPDDRLLVFFAGHGQDFVAPNGRTMGYLIPSDGDPDFLTSRCVSMADVDLWGDLIPAKHILFLMDCCYSGLAATRNVGLSPQHKNYLDEVTRRPVRQIITAGRADQKVMEDSGQGFFTGALVRGIRGDADQGGRGFVTGFDLGHYVETRVYEDSHWRQQPMFRYLRGDGEFLFLPSGEPPGPSTGPAVRTYQEQAMIGSAAAGFSTLNSDDTLRDQVALDFAECLRVILNGTGSRGYVESVGAERLGDWQRAADLGWPEAQYLFGRCFETGVGVEKDEAEAVKWYREAAEQGLANAQFNLGLCSARGDGVEMDAAEAVKWYRRAAEQGNVSAKNALERRKGGCFISSAVGSSLGWADNAWQLDTLRSLRDTYMQETSARRAQVREYYRIAPGMVRSIDASTHADLVYRSLCSDYILPAVKAILLGKMDFAYSLYCAMVARLKREYPVRAHRQIGGSLTAPLGALSARSGERTC